MPSSINKQTAFQMGLFKSIVCPHRLDIFVKIQDSKELFNMGSTKGVSSVRVCVLI